MLLDVTLNRKGLEIEKDKTDSQIFEESVIAAANQQGERFKSRLMQRELSGLLNQLRTDKNEKELTDVQWFLLRTMFDEARFPISVNQLLVQVYDKLDL